MAQCPTCGMQVDDLEQHAKTAHPGVAASASATCPVCGMQVDDLEEHKKTAHPGM